MDAFRLALVALSLTAACPGWTPGQTAPAHAARILGQVVGQDGKPVADAMVSALTPSRVLSGVPLSLGHALPEARQDAEVVSARTDREGRFRLEVEEARWYGLVAERGAEQASTLCFPVVGGDTVTLRLRGTRPVHGKVIEAGADATAAPVAGAEVLGEMLPPLSPGSAGVRAPAWVRRIASGRDGTFAFAIPDGVPVMLSAAKDGKASARHWQAPPATAAAPGAPAPSPVTLELVRPRAVRGVVLDARTKTPVAGAEVRWRIDANDCVRTDAQGRFALGPVRRHSELVVVAPTHRLAAVRPSPDEYDGNAEVRVELVPGLRLEGRLLRADGTALTGARLLFGTNDRVASNFATSTAPGCAMRQERDGLSGFVAWPDQVGDQGALRLAWLQPGVPVVGFVEVDGVWTRFLCATPAADVELKDLVLATDKLEGAVLAPDGSPIGGASVRLVPDLAAAGDTLRGILGNQWVATVTNRAGKFRIEGLLPGRYSVAATAPGNGFVPVEGAVAPAIQPVELRLPAGERLEGKVTGARGQAIPDAAIELRREGSTPATERLLQLDQFWCRSDHAGRFAFRGLPPGDLRLTATAEHEGRTLTMRASVASGTLDLQLELRQQ